MPVYIAKAQYLFTDDQKQLDAPTDFTFYIRGLVSKIGVDFVVVLADNMMAMSDLPKEPTIANMTTDGNDKVTELL